MIPTSRDLAERATFEALLNCYLNETRAGQWVLRERWESDVDVDWVGSGQWVVDLELHHAGVRLAIEAIYRSKTGRSRFGRVRSADARGSWRGIERGWAVQLLLRELSLSTRGRESAELARTRELELLFRVVQSQQLTGLFIAARRHDEVCASERFIDSEQSLLFGHWLHPTPKSRQGVSDWELADYSPELRGAFQLHYVAARRDWVRQDSAVSSSAERIVVDVLREAGAASVRAIEETDSRNEVILPVHPLQMRWLLHQPHVRVALRTGAIRELGPLGPVFTPTSSVRTVYSECCDWMFKLSVPIKITNSLRMNKQSELPAGVLMKRLLDHTGFTERHPQLQIIADPAYLSVAFPGMDQSGFEVVLRKNPFKPGQDRGIHCIAAVVQDPLPHRASRLRVLIEGLALAEGRSTEAVSREWFERYWSCAVEPLIRLYDEHGVAVEAHQQNSLVDVAGGYPRRSFYRDNQGYYLSSAFAERLMRLEPRLTAITELFYTDDVIRTQFAYYLVSNQLFSVVCRFGSDGLLDEESCLAACRRRLLRMRRALRGPACALVDALLSHATIPYKANLLTRLRDVDELVSPHDRAAYTTLQNPLRQPGEQTTRMESGRQRVVA